MQPAASSPLQVTSISHKLLQSASHYCLLFPNPSFGPRATCPPAPRVPCSCAWAESCPLPSLAAQGMIWGTGTSAGAQQCQQPLGEQVAGTCLSWGWLSPM